MQQTNLKALVMGVGNKFRNDDSVGLVVARNLRARIDPSIAVLECPDDGAQLMESWSGYDRVILVDAVSSGKVPGTIGRYDLHRRTVPPELFHCSTHAFGVAAAIELSRTLHALPEHFILYGVESSDFGIGTELSPAVRKAADSVAAMVLGEFDPVEATMTYGDRAGLAAPTNC